MDLSENLKFMAYNVIFWTSVLYIGQHAGRLDKINGLRLQRHATSSRTTTLEGRVGRSAVHTYLQANEILEGSSNLKTEIRVYACDMSVHIH